MSKSRIICPLLSLIVEESKESKELKELKELEKEKEE
jgi:hypothetical protein